MFARFLLLFPLLATTGIGTAAAERPLAIDLAQSRVEVAVRASGHSFVGKLIRFDASVTLTDDGRVTAARLAFQWRDLATGKEGRDQAMHTWQETDRFPEGLFALTSLDSTPAPGSGFIAIGRLTLHGMTRDIRFSVSVAKENNLCIIDGEAVVDTREFGLPIIRLLLLLTVDPLVRVRFHLQGNPGS